MYRATATALALVSFLPRVGVGYQPVDACCPPPCGCEAPPVVCCDPCEPSAPATKKDRPKSSGPLPTPADAETKKPAPQENAPAESPTPTLAPNADAITPQPLNTPDIETTIAPPAEAPAEPAPRYADPPAAAPAPVEPTRYDDIFSNTPESTEPPAAETTEPAAAESQTPAPETEPADEPAPAEPADPASVDDPFTAPAEETPPTEETTPPAEESTPAPAEAPATETPEGEELFGPSAARDVLTQPGGWASDASRPWNDAEGQLLVTGRITEVTAKFVVLLRENGQSQSVRYSHLGDEDLSFLRQQIEARRVQLASQAGGDELLAEQSR